MTLENIVPSIEDCKRIPDGAFNDSALVYVHFGFSCQEYGVACRDNCHHADVIIPAPTLAEILAEINAIPYPAADYVSLRAEPDGRWKVHNGVKTAWDKNPATAALRLWMRLKEVQG